MVTEDKLRPPGSEAPHGKLPRLGFWTGMIVGFILAALAFIILILEAATW